MKQWKCALTWTHGTHRWANDTTFFWPQAEGALPKWCHESKRLFRRLSWIYNLTNCFKKWRTDWPMRNLLLISIRGRPTQMRSCASGLFTFVYSEWLQVVNKNFSTFKHLQPFWLVHFHHLSNWICLLNHNITTGTIQKVYQQDNMEDQDLTYQTVVTLTWLKMSNDSFLW